MLFKRLKKMKRMSKYVLCITETVGYDTRYYRGIKTQLFILGNLNLGKRYYGERFEPRSHFKSRLCLIVLVNVVLNRTVVVDSD